jgi:hypothetical protein
VTLTCEQQAKEVTGNESTSWYMKCPACEDGSGRVWGTDYYTDDSTICAAAIHAGLMQKAGGTVLVTWLPGQPTYIGSTKNGIASADYGKWERSFFVQSVDETGKPTSPVVTPPPAGTIALSCAMGADVLTAAVGNTGSVQFTCPSGCTTGKVWGTDVYTGDSNVCAAAVHAGAVTADKGGSATITLGGPQPSFKGSSRNGVTTQSYEKFDTSFSFQH